MKLPIADFRFRICRGPQAAVLILALLAGGCAAGTAFRQGESYMHDGNVDEAVVAYRKAAQAAPDNATYKIALQRALQAASRVHLDKAREYEKEDQLEAALGEYKAASEYEPSNRTASAKVAELDRTIRERIEASRPKPAIVGMRERARAASAEPILNPASREPLNFHFNNVSLRDILNAIGAAHGISVSFDREFADRAATVNLEGISLEPALNQIMTMNQLSYKVLGEKSIFVFQDIPTKHVQYDDQVIRTFYLSHADSTEVQQILSTIIRLPGIAVQPAITGNKTANSITVRGTTAIVGILEKIIEQNDKPRAEVVIDVEILEVDRARSKTYGLNLSEYALGGAFSPESSPSGSTTGSTGGTGATGGTGTTSTNTGTSTGPSQVRSPAPFNLNTISRGVSTADFYLAVPTAIVRFLESDTNTKVIAKPQLRGAEGTKLTLNLGQRIPVISTSYTPIATGGAGVNPLSSYQYQDIGVNVDMTPTVTLDGDIRLDLTLDNSQLGPDTNVGGVTVPSFVQRKVSTRLRLRDGESNLLAGLLQTTDHERRVGVPGTHSRPVSQRSVRGQHGDEQPDRNRDAADAAHRPGARDHGNGSPANLHRLSAESRNRRAAAVDRAAAARCRAAARPSAGAGGSACGSSRNSCPRTRRHDRGGAAWIVARARDGPAAASDAAGTATARAAAGGRRYAAAAAVTAHCASARAAARATARWAAGGRRRSHDVDRDWLGASAHIAARTDVPGRWRSVHRSVADQRCVEDLDGDAHAHLRSDETPREQSSGGELPAVGWCARRVHAVGERESHRHLAVARRGCDRRVGHWRPGRDSLRRDWPRPGDVDTERLRHRTWRRGDGAPIHAGDGHGAVAR